MRSQIPQLAERILKLTNEDRASRQTGKSHALVELCMKRSGLFVASSRHHAANLKREYPNLRVSQLYELKDRDENVYVDHQAYEFLVKDMLIEMERMQQSIERLKREQQGEMYSPASQPALSR